MNEQPLTTRSALAQGLAQAGTDHTRAVLQNPDLFAYLLGSFNQTLKMASGKPADIAASMAQKALATGKLAGKASGSADLVVGITAAQMLVTTAALVSVAGKGPAGAAVAVGAAFAKKTSLALGLAGKDDKRAKCLAAMADLAAAGLTTAALAPTAATGIGALLLAGSLAQLALAGYQAHQTCTAEASTGEEPRAASTTTTQSLRLP